MEDTLPAGWDLGSNLEVEGIAFAPGRQVRLGPVTLIPQTQGALQDGMAIDKVSTIQERLSHGGQFRLVKAIHQLLPKAVHLGSNIHWQGKLLSQLDDAVQVLDL